VLLAKNPVPVMTVVAPGLPGEVMLVIFGVPLGAVTVTVMLADAVPPGPVAVST
jgi:hypothetical protein